MHTGVAHAGRSLCIAVQDAHTSVAARAATHCTVRVHLPHRDQCVGASHGPPPGPQVGTPTRRGGKGEGRAGYRHALWHMIVDDYCISIMLAYNHYRCDSALWPLGSSYTGSLSPVWPSGPPPARAEACCLLNRTAALRYGQVMRIRSASCSCVTFSHAPKRRQCRLWAMARRCSWPTGNVPGGCSSQELPYRIYPPCCSWPAGNIWMVDTHPGISGRYLLLVTYTAIQSLFHWS